MEAFWAPRLGEPAPQVAELTRLLAAELEAPSASVEELAHRCGVSVRTLQRTFARLVGLGPKEVLQRHRVREAAERVAASEAGDLARIAAELGHADQAHLSRDVRVLVGRSPATYAAHVRRGPSAAGARG